MHQTIFRVGTRDRVGMRLIIHMLHIHIQCTHEYVNVQYIKRRWCTKHAPVLNWYCLLCQSKSPLDFSVHLYATHQKYICIHKYRSVQKMNMNEDTCIPPNLLPPGDSQPSQFSLSPCVCRQNSIRCIRMHVVKSPVPSVTVTGDHAFLFTFKSSYWIYYEQWKWVN